MPTPENTPPAPFSEAEAASLLASRTKEDNRFVSFELAEIVQVHPYRIVARGRLGDHEVYVKLHNEPDGAKRVRAARAEYFRASRVMGDGSLRVARHVASSPRLKLIAVESIGGARFDHAVENSPPDKHRELHRLAGAWIKHFSGPTVTLQPFDPVLCLSSIKGLVMEDLPLPATGTAMATTRRWANEALGPEDIARRDALRTWIVSAAFAASGRPISIAATHDDFDPRNLSFTPQGALVGYDLGHLFRCPLAECAAIFLTVQQLRQGDLPKQRRMGLNPAYLGGFLDSELLPPEEASVFLPLYVAHKWDLMLSRHAVRPSWLQRVRIAIDAFLDEFSR